jgi:hypothetical protein
MIEKDGEKNALCFAGLVHHEDITERWIQRISREGYKS